MPRIQNILFADKAAYHALINLFDTEKRNLVRERRFVMRRIDPGLQALITDFSAEKG